MPESNERGALTEAVFYILLSLHAPMHGYGIMQNISQLTDGRVKLGAGTLYGALNTLCDKGWIETHDDGSQSKKKSYVITQNGSSIFEGEIKRLNELLKNARGIK